ncbi:MAG: hypothetical protein M0Z99_09465 [Betaproteobacteria bacterium]|nr:hypothetical protein [Betaproteobacteria bacterium]
MGYQMNIHRGKVSWRGDRGNRNVASADSMGSMVRRFSLPVGQVKLRKSALAEQRLFGFQALQNHFQPIEKGGLTRQKA